MPRYTRVCIPCRAIQPTGDACQNCGGALRLPPKNWRAPRKTNDTAWRRVADGEWLWDRKAVRRAARRWYPWRPSARLAERMLRPEEVSDRETWKGRFLGPRP